MSGHVQRVVLAFICGATVSISQMRTVRAALSQSALLPFKARPPATPTEARAVDTALRRTLAGQRLPSVDEGALQRLQQVLPDPCSDAACLGEACALVGAAVLVGGRLLREKRAFVVQLWAYDRREQRATDLWLATGQVRCAGCNLSRLGSADEGLLLGYTGLR